MKNYIKLCLWALVVLWKEKTISRANRVRLWKKTLNLFICILAFADKKRSEAQLHGAMVNALLSAVYDYETDWVRRETVTDSIYLRFLEKYAVSSVAYQEAYDLFVSDWKGTLSRNGLERGGTALLFYHSLIKSEWLNKYSNSQIISFGKLLQIIDDLLDFSEDKAKGHANCLLTEGREQHIVEVKEFLESEFFKTLEGNSYVYRLLRLECSRVINELEGSFPLKKELIHMIRPHTGLFAIVLAIIGFRYFSIPLLPMVSIAAVFAGITLSIMVFNDYVDRKRDVQKGKMLAFRHPMAVLKVWGKISKVSMIVLMFSAVLCWQLALFCGVVWVIGLLYSVMRPRYPMNNVIVAFCSASPVLSGMLYLGILNGKAIVVFFIIFSIIFLMELVKDIQDMEGDAGYKKTLPVLKGKIASLMTAIMLCYISAFCVFMYFDTRLALTTLFFVPIVFSLAISFIRERAIYWAERWGDAYVLSLITVLLVIQ